MSRQRPALLQILELTSARRDGALSPEEFESELARLKARSSLLLGVPGKIVALLAVAALVVAGLVLY